MQKYHAELKFSYKEKVRFTAETLERLMARFNKEVKDYDDRRRAARDYTYVIPNLRVEVCSSWSEFKQFEVV
jgi:uncharacterized protein YbbC (DUF1343 family)